MSDLAVAPQTGASEPVQSGAADTSAPAKPEAKAVPSARDAMRQALATVEAREAAPLTERDKAAAVLKDGAGADDKLVAERAAKAEAEANKPSEASERAKAGWETRRANEEKAAADATKAAEREKAEAVKTAESKAAETKPAEKVEAEAKPAEAKPEPSKHKAPARLSKEAQAAWDAAPEPLRADVVRMHDEMNAGLAKYKDHAERYAELAEYEKMAQEAYGAPLKEVMKNYADLDKGLGSKETWFDTLEKVVSMSAYGRQGGTMATLAKWMGEQGMLEDAAPQDKAVLELRQKNEELARELSSFKAEQARRQQTETEQTKASIDRTLESFKAESPRFSELQAHIADLLTDGIIHEGMRYKVERTNDPTHDLRQAYRMAERLNPAPSLPTPAPEIPAPAQKAQTLKGQLSVSGAPGQGSDPAARQPVPATRRDAVKQALAAHGIS